MSDTKIVGEQHVESVARFLDIGRHSDFEIESGGHIFRVHKTILCAKSAFFDRLCATQFQESVSSRITLDDEDPAIIARMPLYIYINTYPVSDIAAEGIGRGQFRTITDPFKNDAFDTPEWAARASLHALMFAAAEKYWALGLEKHSAHRFVAAFCESTDYALRPEKEILNRSSDDEMNTSSVEETSNSQSQLGAWGC